MYVFVMIMWPHHWNLGARTLWLCFIDLLDTTQVGLSPSLSLHTEEGKLWSFSILFSFWSTHSLYCSALILQDWWNSTSFANYYRTWNVVVHDWLYYYGYRDFLWVSKVPTQQIKITYNILYIPNIKQKNNVMSQGVLLYISKAACHMMNCVK